MPSPPVPDRRVQTGTAGVAGLVWSAVPALIAFVVAGVFLFRAGDITGLEATYPVVLAIAVLVIGLVNLVRDLLVKAANVPAEQGEGDSVPMTSAVVLRLLAFVAVLLAALVLLEPAGFFPAMVVMVVGSLVCFGVRNPLVIAAATALTVGCAYLVFVRLLVVPFPPGFLDLT
jgi:hypothetical protein